MAGIGMYPVIEAELHLVTACMGGSEDYMLMEYPIKLQLLLMSDILLVFTTPLALSPRLPCSDH